MQDIGRRRSLFVLGILLSFTCAIALGGLLLRAKAASDEFTRLSAKFVEQVDALGATLKPGDVGTIRVSRCDADELVLLPAYCDEVTLSRFFSDRSVALVDEMQGLSRTEQPALIWLRAGRIVSINPLRFSVGMNLALQSWSLDGEREIRVAKEPQSSNGFLSLYFPMDDAAR